ncbi:MAG: glycosyltransferase family 2 protein, partial [Candidatus Aenigmatarchaeota archaeon]
KISIIIPTRNEEKSIAKVLRSIPKEVKKFSEIIVVDSSEDKTPIIAKKLGAKVVKAEKKGKGYAMRLGAEIAKGDTLIFLDGDCTDPPEYIPKILEKIKDYDMILCSKNPFDKNSEKRYKIIYSWYIPFVRSLFRLAGFKIKYHPLTGYRAIKKDAWKKINPTSNDFLIETEINLRAAELNLRVSEIPVPILKRGGGFFSSKLVRNPRQLIRIFTYIFKYILRKWFTKKGISS